MAERHTIIVRIRDGEVTDVLFCDCCPVSVEVRNYKGPTAHGSAGLPVSDSPARRYKRDEVGAFDATYYEPED